MLEVTEDLTQIDDAMKLGYNWVKGPFELLDEIGVEYFIDRLQKDGREVPSFLTSGLENGFYTDKKTGLSSLDANGFFFPIIRPKGVLRFSEIRQTLSSIRDRKSTRLNSSHKPISYAVFCLKKKKNKKTTTTKKLSAKNKR